MSEVRAGDREQAHEVMIGYPKTRLGLDEVEAFVSRIAQALADERERAVTAAEGQLALAVTGEQTRMALGIIEAIRSQP